MTRAIKFGIMLHIERAKRMTENDLVKLVNAEPEATGRVRSIKEDQVVVVWNDGIVCKHERSELRVVRLEQLAGTWMGFLTF